MLWIVNAIYKLEFVCCVIYSGNPRYSCQRKVNVVGRRARSNGQFSIRRCHTSGKESTQTTHRTLLVVCSALGKRGSHDKERQSREEPGRETTGFSRLSRSFSRLRRLVRSRSNCLNRQATQAICKPGALWSSYLRHYFRLSQTLWYTFNFLWGSEKKNKPHVNVCKTSTFLSLDCLTCDVGKSSLTLLFSQQASVFYRVSPKHKVAIVKVCLAITLFLLYSHLLCFFFPRPCS